MILRRRGASGCSRRERSTPTSGFPPDPQELRARKVGHVVVNSAVDRPWSQYFCCMVVANREFVRKHPVATKRALRAILKGADICALEPERAARALVDGGFTPRYDYALQTMKDVPYDKWRAYDPEDTVRFYALRLHEAGMIKSSPQKTHRAGHRLAVPERAEEGAEGMMTTARFLTRLSRRAPPAWLGGHRRPAAEPPPETTRAHVVAELEHLQAPQYVAEDLLRGEGFTDVRYVETGRTGGDRGTRLASGEADISMDFVRRR